MVLYDPAGGAAQLIGSPAYNGPELSEGACFRAHVGGIQPALVTRLCFAVQHLVVFIIVLSVWLDGVTVVNAAPGEGVAHG